MAVSNIATYPINEFMKAAGVSEHVLRAAKRKGLRVLAVGQKRYVRGADWEAFLLSHNQPTGDEG